MPSSTITHCWNTIFGNDPLSAKRLEKLLEAYSEKHRHYHTTAHISALLEHCNRFEKELQNPLLLRLAILYHDYVYDPSRKDNELRSAEIAVSDLLLLRQDQELTGQVRLFILSTEKHEVPAAAGGDDLRFFLDFDLSVLAADEAEYDAYAAAVRREFSIYPDFLYKPGRKKVLRHFLDSPRIYKTALLHESWEKKARANLQREYDLY